MAFSPKKHLIKLQGKDYLETKWRIVWFRHDHPTGAIDTELLTCEPGLAIVRAVIALDGNVVATGIASADSREKKAMWSGKEIMKAETAAIGRALAHAGYGTQFTDEVEGDFLADSPVESPPKKDTPQLWPSSESVKWVVDAFTDDGITQSEILALAGVKSFDDGDGWRKYKDAQAAVTAIMESLDDATNNGKAQPMAATFTQMSYIGHSSNLQFKTADGTTAILFGGRGAITEMHGNDELYEQLELSQYDKIKGKNSTSDFKKMFIDVEFRFVSEVSKQGENYFKITGIVGDPGLKF